MAKTNTAVINRNTTHEGGPALPNGTAQRELRRAVASCMLWEDNFYESGVEIGARIKQLAAECPPQFVLDLAVEARDQMKLRHAPLWLLVGVCAPGGKPKPGLAAAVVGSVRRADEPGELIALYAKAWPAAVRVNASRHRGVRLPAGIKRGLARAVRRFDEYQLAKYNRKAEYSFRDVLRLTHAKPQDEAQAALWKRAIAGELATPDTWEVALSTGGDKKTEFTRLLEAGNLGYLALLRNLRNMDESGVDRSLVHNAIRERKGAHNVLPFRYVAAARAAPSYENTLDEALCASLDSMPALLGETIVLVDVSISMQEKLSGKSDLRRIDAAATLASIIPGRTRVFAFNNGIQEVPPRKGMAGVDALVRLLGGGTSLGAAIEYVNRLPHDRLIVITDEQSQDRVGAAKAKHAYMLNVAGYRPEVGYGAWTRISGFSENALRFITDAERLGVQD